MTKTPRHDKQAEGAPGGTRGGRRTIRGLFLASVIGAPRFMFLLGLAVWLVGRAVGDRYLWTQYPEWIPTELVAVAGLLTLPSLLPRRPRALRRVTAGTIALLLGWLAVGDWQLHRAVLSPSGGSADPVRVVFLNISYHKDERADLAPLFDAGADIALLSNVHPQPVTFEKIYGIKHASLLERVIGAPPAVEGMTDGPAETRYVRHGMFRVLSRWPIRRRAFVPISKQESWIQGDTFGGGGLLLIELETPSGPMVVWVVDLPRTLGASRRAMLTELSARVAGLDRAQLLDGIGRWVTSPIDPDDPIREPALVVGDFNTPSHAWSIRTFLPGMRPARADAGLGPRGTFPAEIPLSAIDHAWLSDGLEARAHRTFIAPGCRHRGIVLEIAPR